MMRLSLRLSAERSDRDDLLGEYLDDPMRLFIPARMVLAIIYVVAGALLARVIAMQAGHGLPTLIAAMAVFALVCEHLIPLMLIRRDPEAVLAVTLPAFHAGGAAAAAVDLRAAAGRPAAHAAAGERRGQRRRVRSTAPTRRSAAEGAARRRSPAPTPTGRCCARSSTSGRRWCARS